MENANSIRKGEGLRGGKRDSKTVANKDESLLEARAGKVAGKLPHTSFFPSACVLRELLRNANLRKR